MNRTVDSNVGNGRFVTLMVVAAVVVVVDQLTKWAIVEWIPLYDRVPLNSFINLTLQKNAGAAFS
ncbi:MAG: signal peptidase II, partial [Woeseiaceae bacterium]|nr:signal peptidase II [Woeseiaceae bacterium]